MGGGAQQSPRCRWHPTVDRHFAGRIVPADESALRAHLPGCASCLKRYDRHLLREQLSRPRLGREDRLAIGMGLPPRRGPLPVAHLPALGLAVAAGAVALVLVARGDRALDPGNDQGHWGTSASLAPSAITDAGAADQAAETGPEAVRLPRPDRTGHAPGAPENGHRRSSR